MIHATEDGGALVARTVKSSVSIGNSSFVGNAIAAAAASGDGGAVSLDGVGTVSLSLTTMKRNSGKNGGALCITTSKSVELDSCSITENKATLGGGAFMKQLQLLKVSNSHFESNAAIEGTNVYSSNSTEAVVQYQSRLLQRAAEQKGGGLSAKYIAGLALTTSTASKAQAKEGRGGALYLDTVGVVKVKAVVLSQNTASLQGGGCRVQNPNGLISFTGCIISECKAAAGAGLWVAGAELPSNSKVSDLSGAHLVVKSARFSKNVASGSGGALFIRDVPLMSLASSEFEENKALQGAGAYLHEIGKAQIDSVTINDAQATGDGGALFLGSGSGLMASKLSVNRSKAHEGGGIMCVAGAHAEITDSSFSGNVAQEGAAIFGDCGCDLTLSNSTLNVIDNGDEPVKSSGNCTSVLMVNCTMTGNHKYSPPSGSPSGFWWIILAMILVQVIGLTFMCWKLIPVLARTDTQKGKAGHVLRKG